MNSVNNFSVDVSVAIMTYFHEDYIEKAVNSVLSQKTKYSYEIVITDDCSEDKTRDILLRLQEKYPNVIRIFLNDSNLGISLNSFFNHCQCRGRYIAYLEGDDYWIDNEKIEKQVSFMDKHPNFFSTVTPIQIRVDDSNQPKMIIPQKRKWNKTITLKQYLKGEIVSTHGLMMRNIYNTPEGREYFSLVPELSKYIDDATECVLLLQKSPTFILDFESVAYRIHSKKEGKHNYNSLNTKMLNFKKIIELYNKMFETYNGRLNLYYRYKENVSTVVFCAFNRKKKEEFWNIYRSIPSIYKRRGLFLSSIFYKFVVFLKKIRNRIARFFKKRTNNI